MNKIEIIEKINEIEKDIKNIREQIEKEEDPVLRGIESILEFAVSNMKAMNYPFSGTMYALYSKAEILKAVYLANKGIKKI